MIRYCGLSLLVGCMALNGGAVYAEGAVAAQLKEVGKGQNEFASLFQSDDSAALEKILCCSSCGNKKKKKKHT